MLAVSYVYETSEGYFCKHNAFFMQREAMFVDAFDFDGLSCLEWICQLKRHQIETYVFIGGGKRLKAFVAFLNKHTDIKFYILRDKLEGLPIDVASLLLKWCKIPQATLNQLNQQYRYTYQQKADEHFQRFVTGNFLTRISKHTLYYINLGEGIKMTHLDTSVLLNCAINATFYCESVCEGQVEPFITLPFRESYFLNKCTRYSKSHVGYVYKAFVKEGRLPSDLGRAIVDVSCLLNDFHLNRLIVNYAGIYIDCSKRFLLSKDLDAPYDVLLKHLEQWEGYDAVPIYYEAFCSLLNHLDLDEESKYYLLDDPDIGQNSDSFAHFVGIQKGFECFVYNAHNNRAYAVSNAFLEQFVRYPKINAVDQMRLLLKEKFV